MDKIPFKPADILLPMGDFEKWSVIACDQFTSDRKYWEETREVVGDANSTLKITLPESAVCFPEAMKSVIFS